MQLQIYKIQDDGNNKCSKKTIEDMTISTNGLVDNLRTGENNRSTNTKFMGCQTPHNFNCFDYIKYFSQFENYINSYNKNEGLIIKITWKNIDMINLLLKYRLH